MASTTVVTAEPALPSTVTIVPGAHQGSTVFVSTPARLHWAAGEPFSPTL
jgi:hypothetical protein